MRIPSIFALSLAAATVIGSGAALAGPLSTWNPGALPGFTGGQITQFDNFNATHYASITVNTLTGNFSEVGALNVTTFLNGGTTVLSPGLGSTYSLYYTFTATGNQGGGVPSCLFCVVSGPINSLNYTLWATPNSSPVFTASTAGVAITGNGGAVAVATGQLGPGLGNVSLTKVGGTLANPKLAPASNFELTFNPCLSAVGVCTGNESAFFVSPSVFATVFEEGNFGASSSVTTISSGGPNTAKIVIAGGAGNITETVDVPEPFTLSLFGAGLAGAAAIRRRKAKKA